MPRGKQKKRSEDVAGVSHADKSGRQLQTETPGHCLAKIPRRAFDSAQTYHSHKAKEPNVEDTDDESDSDTEKMDADFSSMTQPSLIKQLKGILSEYPDGGQIIKELIQNAEDAGASEVKILFDGRRVNRETKQNMRYSKFFQSPSLCVYNDASFTQTDWEGIRMIYSSVKENDRLKVGRFGLGFKSVFHITDYPCILSGDQVLLIDPQQKIDNVNAIMNLSKLEKYKGMDIKAFLKALDGTFGINEGILKKGHYAGTLFWFPLRESPSTLSETLYDEKKVMALFESFRTDASTILIFLRSTSRISLHSRTSRKTITDIAKVEIVDNGRKIQEKRRSFQEIIKEISTQEYTGEPKYISYTMTVQSKNCIFGDANDKMDTIENKCQKWQVVNYFMGQNASPAFQSLIRDPALGYIPFVGVAAPLDTACDMLVGHVFCFLPLPKEGSRLTGLPVHVNGYFALSQNRHHLKWATEDQKLTDIHDKAILWNEKLVTECLPQAYGTLIQELVKQSEQAGNSEESVAMVYRAIPDLKLVEGKWERMLPAIFQIQKNKSVFFTANAQKSGKGEWITIEEARFALLENSPTIEKNAIVNALRLCKEKYVEIPRYVFETLKHFYSCVNDLSPDKMCFVLQQNDNYKCMPHEMKLALASYILSDNDYRKVNGLKLLPLASGSWTQFEDKKKTVYICSDLEMALFPGFEDRIVMKHVKLANHFEDMARQGISQVRKMTSDESKKLIKEILVQNFGEKCPRIMTFETKTDLTIAWQRSVWDYLAKKSAISTFENVSVLPLLRRGTWEIPREVELVCLTELIALQEAEGESFPKEVCLCLEALSVKVLPSLPHWIHMSEIDKYVGIPSHSFVLKLFARLFEMSNVSEIIETFNRSCQPACREALLQFLGGCSGVQNNEKELLKRLKLFKEKRSPNSDTKLVSLCENKYFTNVPNFPVKYPIPFLEVGMLPERLQRSLDIEKIRHDDLILKTLKSIQHSNYTEDEVMTFMEYLIGNWHNVKKKEEIIQTARPIPFLRTTGGLRKPSDLFNPLDSTLQDLLLGENCFSVAKVDNDKTITILRSLGLKFIDDLNADNLITAAKVLDTWSRQKQPDELKVNKKAIAFLKVLNRFPDLLEQKCQDNTLLKHNLANLNCIKYDSEGHRSFPKCLPLFLPKKILFKPDEVRDSRKSHIVGSTMPIVQYETELVSKTFGWNDDPPIEKVLEQLEVITKTYKIQNKPDILIVLKNIYQQMNKHQDIAVELVAGRALIWNGEGFSDPDVMITCEAELDDLDLKPHFYAIPEEFRDFHQLFRNLGCKTGQSVDVLVETLFSIQKKHIESGRQQMRIVHRDMALILLILEKLADKISDITEHSILVPIQTDDNRVLVMKPALQCTYDRKPAHYDSDDDEDPVYFIHERVSVKLAKALGILSLRMKNLDETDEFEVENWGQEEPLTTRLKRLLEDSYMDGFTVIKEMVQNADDACATAVKFLYDERENNDAMKHLLCNSMKSCQGPSLWSFNNARFTNEDLANITKLNGATKEQDAKTIGKFGLGFCSVYNLTDVPSFVSGTNIVFFDPHKSYLAEALSGTKPGLKIDFNRPKNKKLLNTHKDQFKPYLGVFGCDLSISELDGTLFRLPLRTHEQAKSSKISSLVYSKEEMQRLLGIFMKSVGNLFLFTQNIQEIEIYHLSSNSSISRKTLLLSAKKKSFRLYVDHFLPVTESVLSKIAVNSPICGDNINEVQKIDVDICVCDKAKRVVSGIDKLPNTNVSTWIVSWACGTSESRDMFVKSERKGVLPLAAIAVPCSKTNTLLPIALKNCKEGFYNKGRMFCYLPLPLETNLQMHINGCFDVTSNRRLLLKRTLDDKGPGNNPWNDALMRDPLVNAFLHLLLTLSKNEVVSSVHYQYSLLWPTECFDIVGTFRKRFFSRIVKENLPVFRSVENDWVPFENIAFLEPQVRQNSDIGQIAYDMLRRCPARHGTVMVDMSSAILSAIVDSIDKDTAERVTEKSIGEIEVLLIFLRNLSDSFWKRDIKASKARNTMVLHALRSDSERLKDVLKETNCIPTDVKHKLRKPSELVHPTCRLAAMFHPLDGRFPFNDTNFKDPNVLQKLLELGMMNTLLPDNMLLERCNSIVELGKKCCECAYERCSNVLRYIKKGEVQTILTRNVDTLHVIKDTYLFPVLSRPQHWKFAWKSETCVSLKRFKNKGCDRPHRKLRTSLVIGQPAKLFSQHAVDFLGSVENMIDEDGLACQRESNILRILGVQGVDVNGIPVKSIVDQLIEISNEYGGQTNRYNEVKRIYEHLFSHIHRMLEENCWDSQTIEYIKVLSEKPVILIEKELVLPQTVAFSLKEECVPHLRRLPSAEILSKRMFYKTVGVREYFSSNYILDILKQKRDKWRLNKCKEIELIKCILINLVDSIKRDKITYKEMEKNVHDCIVAPDVSSVLRPTYELVIDNEEYETSDAMKIIHGCIAPQLAKAIGAKLKKRWCLEDIQIKLKCQPFGQKETLVTRLKGLLDMYPFDANVLKELLQNADDAYATEVHFIKDYRQHPTRKLIERFNELQGPALCVFNNSYFKQDDFRGIQHLGEGSKREDPTKTGQYGVGINVVYHLTDVPTFLTKGPNLGNGGTLCVLDPLLKCVPNSTEPGALFDVDGVKKYFPDTLSGFMLNENLFTSKIGTLFRCPLRQHSSDISKSILSTCDIDNLLAEFKIDMFAALLFLKSVNCIKISNVTSGRMTEEYSIKAHVSEEDKRKREQFYQHTKNIVTGKQNYLLNDPIEVGYEMTISDSMGLRRKWFVVQRFGFDNAKHCLDYTMQDIVTTSLRYQPLGGVAMPLSVVGRQLPKQSLEISKRKYSRKKEKCKTTTKDEAAPRKSNLTQYDQQYDKFNAYCILPLPEKTGFPLHVNGHFVLQHDARREIEKERNGNGMECIYCEKSHSSSLDFSRKVFTKLLDEHTYRHNG